MAEIGASKVIDNIRLGTNQVLTNLVVGYPLPELIADQILPVVSVNAQQVRVPIMNSDHLKIYGSYSRRALGADPKIIQSTADSYEDVVLIENSLSQKVDYREIAEASSMGMYDFVQRAAIKIKTNLLLSREYDIASYLQTYTNYDANHYFQCTSTHQWSDLDDSDILEQISTGINQIRSATGFAPNVFIVAQDAWTYLVQNWGIRGSLFGYNGTTPNTGIITPEIFAAKIGVEKVLIGTASGMLTEGSTTKTQIWTKTAMLAYVPMGVRAQKNINIPALGYTLQHQNTPPAILTFEKDGVIPVELTGVLLWNYTILISEASYLIYNIYT